MFSEYSDFENPGNSAVRTQSKSSSSSSSKNSSIHLSTYSPHPSADRLQEFAQALKALAGKATPTQMASSSHQTRDSSSKDEPRAETLIAHDYGHGTYILGPLCTEPPLFPHIIESFILLNEFNLPITADWFSISLHPKELHSWPNPAPKYVQWLDKVSE